MVGYTGGSEMTRVNRIIEILEDMTDDEIIAIHNEYCIEENCMDDYIYDMEEFDEVMDGETPSAIISHCRVDFSTNNKYFSFDGYDNCFSFDYPNAYISITNIAEYIDSEENALNSTEIEEILEED